MRKERGLFNAKLARRRTEAPLASASFIRSSGGVQGLGLQVWEALAALFNQRTLRLATCGEGLQHRIFLDSGPAASVRVGDPSPGPSAPGAGAGRVSVPAQLEVRVPSSASAARLAV